MSVAELPVDAVAAARYASVKKSNETTAWVGMVIFLASWGMMFGALFFVYGTIRARALNWPPQGLPSIPLFWPSINTLIIFGSSLSLQAGIWAIRKDEQTKTNIALWVTLVLGIVFLTLQCMVWSNLHDIGLMPTSGFYGSVFYGLTWIHAAHVVIGLIALLWLCVFSLKRRYSAENHLSMRLWAMYWHFVGVVWAVVFVTVYLA